MSDLGVSAAEAAIFGAATATGLLGNGVSLATSAGGSCGKTLDTETSDDLALVISGLTSFIDAFLTSASGDGVRAGVSPGTSGFGSSLAGGAETDTGAGSGFLRAKTECPATELRLRVLVKNDGLGLAAERRDCPNGAASWAKLLRGFGSSAGGATCSSAELRGSCGKAFSVEFSEDLALEIGGLASSVDFFSGKICADATVFSSATVGVLSSLISAAEGLTDSGFLSAKTECPDTELLLLVLVRNEGLGLGAERSDGPIGFGFSFSNAGKVLVPGEGEAGTLFSG